LPPRKVLTGIGGVEVRQPRVRDQRATEKVTFISGLLPRYLRRVPSVDALIPALYLRGVSTGDFTEALESILGPNAAGLSAANIVRLKEGWEGEYEQWTRRDLSAKRYVYWWADGVYFNVRLEDQRRCILVVMGALGDGTKELIAVIDGERESKLSWLDVLRQLKAHGLPEGPALAGWDSGRPWPRNTLKRASSAAGFTRRPTSWTNSPRPSNRRPRTRSIKCICPPPRNSP
jgi:transposase-like protein